MTAQDRREFEGYLRACTDAQVRGVWDKERAAGRADYVRLAASEAKRRGLMTLVCDRWVA